MNANMFGTTAQSAMCATLVRDQRLADGVVEDRQDRARAERVGLLADRVHLVGPREARHGREALLPRAVEAALGRPQLEDEVHATSTGVPPAAADA
jgi:hypothetical protein